MLLLDSAVFEWLNLAPDAPALALALAHATSRYLPGALLAGLLAAGLLGRHWRVPVLQVLAGVALAAAAVYLLKHGLAVPRPYALNQGTMWLEASARPSFPSSHATAGMALAVGVCLARWPWAAPGRWRALGLALLLTAGALVGWSRVALGQHFPSDVLAGWCLAFLCALAVQGLWAASAALAGRWQRARVSSRGRS